MIYQRIKELAKTNNISINELEKRIGVAKGSLCKIDKHEPKAETISKLAKELNSTEKYILTGEKPNYSDEMAHMYAKIRKDTELSKALLKYFELSDVEKKKIIDIINVLSDK